ncbi:response regulator [Bacillus salitolerans]|uniref:Response regulator n=1 Tax=Bacillus salitolerans TaxID=1437434 RepID=A0ABW4LII1_9BACI
MTINLLLVDDQELIRESLAIVLGMDPEINIVGLSQNGVEAISFCETNRPDIILMDINMPVMNGIDATKQIKRKFPEIKILILTTFQEVNHVVDALSIGAEGYLLKAIHPKDLIAGIKLVFRGGTLLPNDLAKLLMKQINQPIESTQIPIDPATKYGLTEREVQILECISHGLSNKLIAERLFLSEGTVKNYISSIYHKLDVKDRLQAALKADKEELI